ncbi:MAG: hypothetical protein H6581_00130 [Bacteroidia bacterium]|nr:hypothetical protein [Bacteroidia bacterium]
MILRLVLRRIWLLIMAASLLGLAACTQEMDKKLFQTYTSESGNKVMVYYGEAFGFGPHPLEVRSQKAGEDDDGVLFETQLYNDGANLGEHNISLIWLDNDHAELHLNGQEQKEAVHQVVF